MKILQFICHLDVGGAETLVRELSLSMLEQKHHVTVLLLDPFRQTAHAEAARQALEQRGIPVLTLDRKPGSAPVAAAFSLVNLLRRHRFDVVHSHLPFPDLVAALALKLAHVPTRHVSTIHNSNLTSDGRLWRWSTRLRQNIFCSYSAAAANSELAANASVIVNGSSFSAASSVSESATRRARSRNSLGVGPDDLLLLSIGRITEQKNQSLLVRTLAVLEPAVAQKIKCFLVGSIDPGSDIAALARQCGVERLVHLTGPRSDIPDLLAAADVFISTSLWEGLPLAVLEAMFSGVPCVLSPLAEHREIGEAVPGVFFPDTMNPDSFAQCLERAFALSVAHADMRAARQTSLRPYTMEACTHSYLAFYDKMLSMDSAT